MRILLASEGESDEVVAHGLIKKANPDAEIVAKRFPARGIAVVQKLLPDTVRAAHFGFFDLLIVHFDLDDTLPAHSLSVRASSRWEAIDKAIPATLTTLKGWQQVSRTGPLRHLLMAPSQAMDNWLAWGQEGGNGRDWERKSRHDLKSKLYGKPPIGMIEKAMQYTPSFLQQMDNNTDWPLSLREFWDALSQTFAAG